MNAQQNQSRTEHFLLWVALMAGPVLWLLQLHANYWLVSWACSNSNRIPLFIGSATFLALVVLSLVLSIRCYRRQPTGNEGLELQKFMSSLGILLNILFAFIIITQGVPILIIDPCKS
jgi:hypothetical protein